jgi:hypothetical protein
MKQAVLKVANVRFGQVLVFADEDDHGGPKVPRLVLLQPVPDDFRFTDIREVVASLRVDPEQEVDARALGLLPGEKVVQLGSRRCKCLSGPIGHFADPEAPGISLRQKELDSRRGHT